MPQRLSTLIVPQRGKNGLIGKNARGTEGLTQDIDTIAHDSVLLAAGPRV